MRELFGMIDDKRRSPSQSGVTHSTDWKAKSNQKKGRRDNR